MTTIAEDGVAPAADSQSFLLKRVQPALSGLMDGSLSTLAPIFAVVLATHHPRHRFFQTSFARSFVAVTIGGAIIASLSAGLGILAAN